MHTIIMRNRQMLNLLPILAVASLIIRICGSSSVLPVLTGPDMAYLGSRVVFQCIAPASSPAVTYEFMRSGGVLVATDIDLQGGQFASFSMKVAAASDGTYHCKATAGGQTGVSNSIKLSVVTPASNTRVTSDPFPPAAYEGSRIVLSCDVQMGSHLSYTWFFNRKEVTSSTSVPFHFTGNKLVMESVTPQHAGHYSCNAWSTVNSIKRVSSSTEVQVTVKVYISKPQILFSFFKEGNSYYGNVTCWSSRGTPPANFSLSLDGHEVGYVTKTDSLVAWFHIAMVPGVDMGVAQCLVKSEIQEMISEPVTLEVVPAGGDVKVEVEYLYTADSKLAAAKLNCQVSRGTFLYISWLFNDSALPSVDSLGQPITSHNALTNRGQTLVLSRLSPEESGYYRCRARDSFEDSGPWVESAAQLVQVTEVCLSTIEGITIAFCCFLFLMLAVGSACWYKISDKSVRAHITPTNSEALPLSEIPVGGQAR
ncbi:putative pregnancy-specific beta-1-glycoprotein 7 isoform X2 [Mugil cephalus]|uniref:putative pregnancy-specific beta-1-glycoprotein 7 isoform X2 n=1 Tax=Mugil cephalus TaxID=48193 RepID=UPI001FB681D8|nr:putative pregnancy-specific beta-1-glycoprotein 7 isoform X2 [Mugil cephalus]